MTTTLRAKGPEDLLAAVPVILGFEPEESIVMMTFSGPHRFHARLDLPDSAGLGDAVQALLAPVRRHGAGLVAFVLYTDDEVLARRLADRLTRRFGAAGIEIVDCLRAHQGRWWPAVGTRSGVPQEGREYDAAGHPFRAQAVVEGHVTLGSRAELEASLAPDPLALVGVSEAVEEALPLGEAGLAALLTVSLATGRVATTDELASLLLALRKPRLRERTWTAMSRERADDHVRLWTWVLRRAPADLCADPAALLAFAAWLGGHGALGWCALDRCFAAVPGHPLGRVVALALQQAVPPSTWQVSA